jgi:glutamate synthase (ferredoxin)
MTGGRVVVIGSTGRNFAAGMSGGVAYVLDAAGRFSRNCNTEMVDLERLDELADIELVQRLVRQHVAYTGSQLGERLLNDWEQSVRKFVKVMPRDYKRVLTAQARAAAVGRVASLEELVGVAVNG